MSKKQEKNKNKENEKTKPEKKKIVFNRIGLQKEQQELVLFNVNTPVFTFDIKNEVSKWILPMALYKPDYDGEVMPFWYRLEKYDDLNNKRPEDEVVYYDDLSFDSEGAIAFSFKGEVVQQLHFAHLLYLATEFANLNVDFEDDFDEKSKRIIPVHLKGYEFENLFTFQKGNGATTVRFNRCRMSKDRERLILVNGNEVVDQLFIKELIESYSKRYKKIGMIDPWMKKW